MELQSLVQRFHEQYGFSCGADLHTTTRDGPVESTLRLQLLSERMRGLMRVFLDEVSDLRVARAQLMMEELIEVLEALRDGDEIALADGLADLIYVTLGTGVTFDLPVEDLTREVHRSNMTKDVDGEHKPRKGENYSAPRIEEVIHAHRAG